MVCLIFLLFLFVNNLQEIMILEDKKILVNHNKHRRKRARFVNKTCRSFKNDTKNRPAEIIKLLQMTDQSQHIIRHSLRTIEKDVMNNSFSSRCDFKQIG